MTLIELMIALSIMSVGIMALMSVIPVSIQLSEITKQDELARNAVQDKLAEIRAFVRDSNSARGLANIRDFKGDTFDVEGLLWNSDGANGFDENDSPPGFVDVTDFPNDRYPTESATPAADREADLVTVRVRWHYRPKDNPQGFIEFEQRAIIAR